MKDSSQQNLSDHNKELTLQRVLMAAPLQVLLRGEDSYVLQQAALDCFQKVSELEELLSRFKPDSEITILNSLAAQEPVRVESSTFACLLRCRSYFERTQGAFDITCGPLLELWDVTGRGRVPTEEEIAETLKVVGMDKVLFEEPTHLVYFRVPGVQLDLGGVGKGTAVDACLDLLSRKWKIGEARVSFGRSTVGVLGAWKLEVLSPLDEKKKIVEISVCNEAVSTSSLGPRRFVHRAYKDSRVDHIVDPRTGKAKHETCSFTVVCKSAEEADALSTALCVVGPDKAPELASKFQARMVVFIGENERPTIFHTENGKWHSP